ncbi:leucokinin receptor-related [Anaeramoeba flamelloides]|uniref:Leucokinin receptor-related n=1 Tax=Anaeramoeba flamelloides TaxID=1746091 RepID=A0ABQ8ZBH4_9EUKA|nr:leucokinin receptor-related [Anaeramoeba flamelloides]
MGLLSEPIESYNNFQTKHKRRIRIVRKFVLPIIVVGLAVLLLYLSIKYTESIDIEILGWNFIGSTIIGFFGLSLTHDKRRGKIDGKRKEMDHLFNFIVACWILFFVWWIPTVNHFMKNEYFDVNKPLPLYIYVWFGLVFLPLVVFLSLCFYLNLCYNNLGGKRKRRKRVNIEPLKEALLIESHPNKMNTLKKSFGKQDIDLENNDEGFLQSRDHLIHALQSISNDDEMKKLIINELETSKLSSSTNKQFALKMTLYLYFKSLSYHYWLSKKNVIKETQCSKCPAYVKEDQGLVCGKSIYCNECSIVHLLFDVEEKFEKDHNYWGNNVVKMAFQFVDQFFTSIDSVEDIL